MLKLANKEVMIEQDNANDTLYSLQTCRRVRNIAMDVVNSFGEFTNLYYSLREIVTER